MRNCEGSCIEQLGFWQGFREGFCSKKYDEILVILFGTFILYEIVIIYLHNDYSSVDFRHGCFFLFEWENNRAYVDWMPIWYDMWYKETWSPILVDNTIKEHGYDKIERIKIIGVCVGW